MESIKNLYKYGPGPSSSHTIAPYKAALDFNKFNFDKVVVTLFGSLSLTGKGHQTDKIILNTLTCKEKEVIFSKDFKNLPHPNTMLFEGFKNGKIEKSIRYFSIGGGDIVKENEKLVIEEIYPCHSFLDIKKYCNSTNIKDLNEYIDKFEDSSIDEYMNFVFRKMINSVEVSLKKEGTLIGPLKIKRIAKELFLKALSIEDKEEQKIMLLSSFAYAVSEDNSSGAMVITAPTCGSSGVIPSIVYYEYKFNNISKEKLIKGLKVAALFGNIAKMNASVSGAVGGCQAEVGVASAMGAALFSYIYDLSIDQIEYASEVALEHFLGLTCDPVKGYVQIPCIERNGIGVIRSYSSFLYAKYISPLRKNKVSYDKVIEAMKITGDDLSKDYKETAIGGLAKIIE